MADEQVYCATAEKYASDGVRKLEYVSVGGTAVRFIVGITR